jgi:D-amino-acid oxidase
LPTVRAVVVGAGISGLTAALRLSEDGHAVRVVAAEPPARSTSAVAAALWYPYRALPQADVTRWAAATFRELQRLAGDPSAGVRMRSGRELFRAETPDPWWREAVPQLERVLPAELPEGFVDGYRLTVPVADTSLHLPWLVDRLERRGVEVEVTRLGSLDDADPAADVVVDCSGLGAEDLAADPTLVPVRGQVVVVEQVGLDEWLLDQADGERLTYVVPRDRTVVLGGTAEVGDRRTEPDAATADAVLARCTRLLPALAAARVVGHKVGLRPTRPAVRLEADVLPSGRPVVHDYGHGGAGVTLSYGCADDVARLVAELS